MTKQAAYENANAAGYRVAREEFSALREVVEADRRRVISDRPERSNSEPAFPKDTSQACKKKAS